MIMRVLLFLLPVFAGGWYYAEFMTGFYYLLAVFLYSGLVVLFEVHQYIITVDGLKLKINEVADQHDYELARHRQMLDAYRDKNNMLSTAIGVAKTTAKFAATAHGHPWFSPLIDAVVPDAEWFIGGAPNSDQRLEQLRSLLHSLYYQKRRAELRLRYEIVAYFVILICGYVAAYNLL